MDRFTVHLDFATDIITNSSSVVYSQASGVDDFHQAIDEVLSHFGTDKKSRDVFDVQIVPNFEDKADQIAEEPEEYEYIIGKLPDGCEDWSWSETRDYIEEKLKIALAEGRMELSDFDDGYGFSSTYYLVTTKDKNDTGLGGLIQGLFGHDATYG